MTNPLRAGLAGVVPSDALLSDDEVARWSVAGQRPAAVVAPATEEEAARVMALATREGWRVWPAGRGTWMEGEGAEAVDLVLSTRRMAAVLDYEPADLTFTVQAGMTLGSLDDLTRPHRQWLPLDPPGGRTGSLGATVALGASGPLRQAFGSPRDHVLGLTLVSGDGRVLRWGGKVVKNVAGFDITRLCIGSAGALGLITSVSARLFPRAAEDLSLVLRSDRASALVPVARRLAESALPLAALELVEPLVAPHGRSGQEAGLVVRVLGSREAVAETERRILQEMGPEGEPVRLEGSGSEAFHERLGAWEEGWDLVLRMALLPSRLGVLLEEVERLKAVLREGGRDAESPVGLAAHAGAGIVRVGLFGATKATDDVNAWAGTLLGSRARLEEWGGSLTLCKAPRSLLREVGARGTAGAAQPILEGLKRVFDPGGSLVPGRIVP